MDMVVAGKKSQKMRHGLNIDVKVDETGRVNWSVVNAQGQCASEAKELATLLGRQIESLEVVPCDDELGAPTIGARIDVFWTDETTWYSAVVL